jgi:hypothetical protein
MNPHAHISLCDDKWIFYYDYVDFNITASVHKYLDLIFNLFDANEFPRDEIELEMYFCIDEKRSRPIYFKSGDFIYLWLICTGCRLQGLN